MFWLVGCAEEPVPPDQAELERVELDWVDVSRETPAIGDLAAGPERALPTWVWLGPGPGAEAGERPLLLMAHGVDGHPTKFEAFAAALAADGIVVAAPAFPVSNGEVGLGGASIRDFAEQPADLRFVLDQLLDAVEDESSPLWGRFDPERVAALGHSMGGATLLGVGRIDGGEPRIRAQAYLSAAVPLALTLGSDLVPSGPPTLVMHGLDDDLPAQISEDLYAEIQEPKWYLGLLGAGHSEAIESQDEPPIPARAAAQAAVRDLVGFTFLGALAELSLTMDELGAEGNTTLP